MSDPGPSLAHVLTEEAQAILQMERRRWNHEGAKLTAVHDELGLTPQGYYLRLNRLLDNPDALVAEPQLVNRLRRLRDARRRARAS
jgi:hypothetical protein